LVLGGLVLAAVVSTRWIRLNLSPSVPRGVYRLAPVPAALTHGHLVVLPVPVSLRPWQRRWVPLLKPVAAVAGETVCHLQHTLYVHGVDFGPIYREAHGHALPQIAEGCFVVPEAHVFLASLTPKSLDARYFGPTPVQALTAQALPLLTWRYPMDATSFMQSLRLRTSQFLTWFMGSTQTQQQYMQSDRKQRDGQIRSLDDPDAHRQAFTQDTGLRLRERFQAWGGNQGPQTDPQAQQRQVWDRQQREAQQRQQRGGWGHGR
jgi:type IV secretory pathway protease TraF